MTLTMWGFVLGALTGIALLLVASRVVAARRSEIAVRVLPYLHDLPHPAFTRPADGIARGALARLARRVDAILGGATSVRRRLERAGLQATVHDFRVEQVLWGLASFGAAAAFSVLLAMRSPGRTFPLLVLCGLAFVFGVMLRDNRLSAQVASREREILAEFPTVAELLALAVAAGEGPVSALERVVSRCHGAMADDLARVLGAIRTGTAVVTALDELASRTGLPVVARFAGGMAVAIERGTPLADVLHAQAADVREAQRRALIESGARREIFMMVPVVFLVLPVTVIFTW